MSGFPKSRRQRAVTRPELRAAALRHGIALGLLLSALAGFFQPDVRAQMQEPGLRVNGSPLVTTRPVTRVGNEWFLPVFPIARALGMDMAVSPQSQTIRVRHADGAEMTYDGRTGEIRQRFILIGRINNYQQIQIVTHLDDLLFPLGGVVALLGVSVEYDSDRNVLSIEPAPAGEAAGSPGATSFFNLAGLEYNYAFTTSGRYFGQMADVRGEGLMGGIRLTGNIELTRTPGRSFLGFTQGTVRADLSAGRRLTLGDQATYLGLDALTTTVRGLGYETTVKGLSAYLYGGRGVGSTYVSGEGLGYAKYDVTLGGFGLRKKTDKRDLAIAGDLFRSDNRSGATVGLGYGLTGAKNQFKAQGLAGWFSGLSSRSILVSTRQSPELAAVDAAGGLGPTVHTDPLGGARIVDDQGRVIVFQEAWKRVPVEGSALGATLTDTFTPFKQLSMTGQWERYGKNFLTAREDARFNGTSNEAVSVALRPIQYLSFNANASDRTFLLGDSDRARNYSYGANASLPGHHPVQFGYFRSIQMDRTSPFERLTTTQYSISLPRLKNYSAFLNYANIELGRQMTVRNVTATVMAEYGKYGRFGVHDQLQLGTNHRFGADWYMPFGKRQSFLRFGLDHLSSRNMTPRLMPTMGVKIPLPHGQSFQMSYLGDRDTHILQFEMNGPIVRRRELARNSYGVPSVVVQSPLVGRVYLDSNSSGRFDAAAKPVSEIRVWLDDQSMLTDARGGFRFEQVAPGAHTLRAELRGVPAGFVFADPAERTIAVIPYRVNSQDFRIIKTGQLTGKVIYLDYGLDADKPVEQNYPDAHILASGDLDTFSEANGAFLLGDLPPGRYQLRLDPATVPSGYAPQPALQTVEVKAGEIVRDVTFRLVIPPKPVIERTLPAQGVEMSAAPARSNQAAGSNAAGPNRK